MSDKAIRDQLLASTAHWTAAVRARESAREDALFHDPWAAALSGEQGMAWIEQRSPESLIPMVLRTRFFDDFLQRLAMDHAIRQIVVMAAGLDTRALRGVVEFGIVTASHTIARGRRQIDMVK
jgi:methyltransferase (TIGR00027 family)